MNMNRLVNMIVRQVTRKLVNKGVSAGIKAASRGKKTSGPQDKAMSDRQGKAMRAMRRLTRF